MRVNNLAIVQTRLRMKAVYILSQNFEQLVSAIKELDKEMGWCWRNFFLEIIIVLETDLSIGVVNFGIL